MTEPFNVLISSAGRRVALLEIFRKTLGELNLVGDVFAIDRSALSSAFHAADRAFVVPSCASPEFIPNVLDVCTQFGIRLLIPTIDAELPIYAASQEVFEQAGVRLAISAPEVVAIAEDKVRTHDWLLENGFPTVAQTSVEEILQGSTTWAFPLIVKPRRGSASIGVKVVASPAELRAAAQDGAYVVETIAPGIEYTLDLLASRHGRAVCVVPRQRLEVRSGESSKGTTVHDPALQELATKLCEALPGAFGPITIQAFVEDGCINVIELNPRFGGGYPLTWEAGGTYPRWIIEEMLGLPSTAGADGWRDGLMMLRYDDAVFVDAKVTGL